MADAENKTKHRFNFGLGEAGNEERTRKPGILMICGITLLTILLIVVMSLAMNIRMKVSLKNQYVVAMDVYTDQAAETINCFFNKIKNNVEMIYGNETYYQYDPTLTLGSVDAVTEAKLTNELSIYKSMDDYMDFCIVYPYGHTVGQISEKTLDYYGSNIYEKLSSELGDEEECWISGPGTQYDAVYYLHRINENAIMMASVENGQLMDYINISDGIEDMNVYVANDSLIVQATTATKAEVGTYLKSGIYRLVDKTGQNQLSRLFLVCTDPLDNGWYLVSAVPYSTITGELVTVKLFEIIFGIIVLALTITFVIMMVKKLIVSVNQTVGRLDVKSQTDLLTGILNKKSFEEIVDQTLSENYDKNGYVLIFMDIDNFKGVNDRCGHDVGDEVLRSFSHTISSVFRESDIKGRLGGDEFCVLMKMPHGVSEEEMSAAVNDVCGRFRDSLHRKATTGRQSMPAVTSSMGAAISTDIQESFESLYHKADTALYHSKHKGKDTWSIYGRE